MKATLCINATESLEPVGEMLAPKQVSPGRPFRDQVGRMTQGRVLEGGGLAGGRWDLVYECGQEGGKRSHSTEEMTFAACRWS